MSADGDFMREMDDIVHDIREALADPERSEWDVPEIVRKAWEAVKESSSERSKRLYPKETSMRISDLPNPHCPLGYTRHQLIEMFGTVGIADFDQWMGGQTVVQCGGKKYDHDKKEWKPDACFLHPHGIVTYTYDVERFIDRLPILD